MFHWLKRLFSVEGMVPGKTIIGEMPSTGSAYGSLIRLAIPSVCEMVLMSLIGMIDTVMVSGMGTTAVAAVGLVGQPRMLFLCVFFALNTGITAVVARRKGENRKDTANLTLRNSILIGALIGVVLMVLAAFSATWIMRFAGAIEGETLEDATIYFKILIYTLPLNAVSMGICAAQRGVGNAKLTMYVNVAANLINVLFNWLLINGIGPFPELGVVGAAIASAIGMVASFILSVLSLFPRRKKEAFLCITRHDTWKLDKECVRSVYVVASSAMLEQLALRFGFFSYAKIVASLGTQPFAAHQVAMQFLSLSYTFGDGIGIAGTALVGQMLGRKRPDLAHMYGKIGQRVAFLTSMVLITLMVTLRTPLVNMYVHTNSAEDQYVRMLAEQLMLIVAGLQIFQTSSVVMSGALRGAGDTKYVARVMLLTVAVMRPALALLFVYLIGTVLGQTHIALLGCWAASLLDMIVRMALCIKRFNGGKWHDIRV